jgi:nucleotide-binding universal stress UspA family protein
VADEIRKDQGVLTYDYPGEAQSMYERILVAVDGSDTSSHALREGIALAKKFATPLRIVHVIENAYVRVGPAEGINVEPIAQAWRLTGQKVLDEASAQARSAGVETETVLLEEVGRVSEVLVEEAKRCSADLIVIGTHGRRGLQHLLLGSVAEGVLRTAPVPVLAVRPRASES